jgi:GTPase
MIDIEEENNRKTQCLLIGAPATDLEELEGLVKTLGMDVVRSYILARLEPTPAYGMGSGKAEELAALAGETGADVIIFDFEIDATKQRNWEKLASRPVFDRHEVILRIFAQRAQTREAVLQVELAKLVYSLPRLAHMYGDMSRQRGGSYGSKGSGETQLELDQRDVRAKIVQVKKELEQVVTNRETQRKRREKILIPSCALVGYTNAGKSSLLNSLTGADAFVEDKLFATLDPTTRRLSLKTGGALLLTDTVGFISNLPHSLVNAFKSTLEEAQRADLLLIVIDASDHNAEKQYATVAAVLQEIDADTTPRLLVLNKMDRLSETDQSLAHLEVLFPGAEHISAKTHEGFDHLIARMCDLLLGEEKEYCIPADKGNLVQEVRRTGIIIKEDWLEDGIHLRARAGSKNQGGARTRSLLEPYDRGDAV